MNLEDIAKKAGVSRSTVSRVLNDEPYVSEKTRLRVKAVIEQEQYRPNPAARALVTRRSEIIGVVIPDTVNVFFNDNSYFPMLLEGIAEGTYMLDYAMLLWLGRPGIDKEEFRKKLYNNRQVDGLVLASLSNLDPLFTGLASLKQPYVMVERPTRFQEIVNYVTVDNVSAAETAVNHLVSLGRRRIAHITGLLVISDGQDRLQGYKNALEQCGMVYNPDLVYEGHFTREAGYAGMKHLLQFKPDAVFAAGDTTARGAYDAIAEAGLSIPDDIAIIGFDDLDIASKMSPTLTTIRQPIQKKGEAAAKLLIDIIDGKYSSPQHILLPTQLIIRESCGASQLQKVS